jgi:hypothetical protein
MKFLLLALLPFIGAAVAADLPPENASRMLKVLLTATADGDYESFQKEGTPAFQSGITKQVFSTVSAQLSPLLKPGYDAQFLTALRQSNLDVYLWKITPKSGKDQFVAKLVVEDGKAAGFWIN